MLEQSLEGERIELVSRAIGPVEADDRSTSERQIADRVERLVAHELVGVAQPFRIEDGVAVDGDRILQRGAEREALLPQRLDVAEEAEGAGAGDLAAECRRIKIEHPALAPDRRRFEVDLDVEPEAVLRRQELGKAAVVVHADRPDDPEVAAQAALL